MNKQESSGGPWPLCSALPLPAQGWHRASHNWAEDWVVTAPPHSALKLPIGEWGWAGGVAGGDCGTRLPGNDVELAGGLCPPRCASGLRRLGCDVFSAKGLDFLISRGSVPCGET